MKKYRSKVEALEEKVKEVLQEEWSEKVLKKAEADACKAEKTLKGETKDKREWFQTHKERQEEKGNNFKNLIIINRICDFFMLITTVVYKLFIINF